jgi:hypothetical protein
MLKIKVEPEKEFNTSFGHIFIIDVSDDTYLRVGDKAEINGKIYVIKGFMFPPRPDNIVSLKVEDVPVDGED